MSGQNSVNVLNPAVDITVRVFDEFYEFAVDVSAAEYDVVNSFFLSVFGSPSAADSFTSVIFRISDETEIPVLTLIEEMRDQNEIQITNTLAYYLNGLRSPTTLLGVNNPVQPNVWAARNVLP
jgi:hypothetical protein